MYSTRSGLVLGFHDCDQHIDNAAISGKTTLVNSTNKYDWLGHGIYMWDNSPARAIEFAKSVKERSEKVISPIIFPAVIGSVINLGFCLDLLDYENLSFLKSAHGFLDMFSTVSGMKTPKNKKDGKSGDLLWRELDCAVVETLHKYRESKNMPPFDSVRGVFSEGEELYENAGFKEKYHIQICIRNPNCIKGYFLPKQINNNFKKV